MNQSIRQIRQTLESAATQSMEQAFHSVPMMREFHHGEWMHKDYYIRHLVETVLRIRLNNEVDAYCLYNIAAKDNLLAAKFSFYLAEEYGHEGMFIADLAEFGLSKDELDAMDPLFSTQKLIGYMYVLIKQKGPLASIVWNWFVEWYSDQYNQTITNRAKQEFGDGKLTGSQAHLDIDESHDHDDLMWSALDTAIENWGSVEEAEDYVHKFVSLISEYFSELHATTVTK